MTNDGKVFDLEHRTAKFGEAVVKFCKNLMRDFVDTVLLRQLLRAATSIGANYVEADDAESKKRLSSQNRFVPKRGAGNVLLAAYDESCKTGCRG